MGSGGGGGGGGGGKERGEKEKKGGGGGEGGGGGLPEVGEDVRAEEGAELRPVGALPAFHQPVKGAEEEEGSIFWEGGREGGVQQRE